MAPTEEVFLRLAGERGLLDPERQEQARRSADSTPPSEFAVRQGWITPHARDVLLAEAAGALAPAVPSVTRSVSRSGRALPDFPGYVILDELGHGGMGIVYQARQTALGRDVALKVLIAGEDATASTLARFEREARAAARLQHPNIVQVHDVGRRGAFHFFTMQLVVGRPLSKAIREGLISPRQALELTQKVALALDYAHAQGVIHRDVKPQNIILDWRGEPLLADFGLAKDVRSEELTALGESIGTPTYASPEQLGGETDRVGPRSDVYSLGATLYQLLTGQPPFVGDTLFSVIQQVLMEEPVPPRRIRANLHRDIETICLKAMEKEASRRYATAREFADDIGRYLEGEPILASTAGRFERSWRRVRRYPLVFGLAAAVLIASVTTGALWWKRVQDRTTAERERAELIRNAREREEAATRERDRLVSDALERLRVTGDALVEASLARRALGDLPGSRKYAEFLWPAVEELKERAPHLAEPWYHEGRMLRALQREEPAEQSQDEAVRLARRPDATAGGRALLASALYERGVLRMLRWLRRLAEKRTAILQARSAGRRPEDAPPETPTEQDVDASHPEVKDVKRLAAEDLDEVPRIAQAGVVLSTAAVALSSYLKGARNAEALLRLALKEDRYRVEVYDALASLAEARGDPEEAARIYEEGHQADRGYLPHLFNEAAQLRRAAAAHPERAIGLLGRAMEAADAALSLDPDSPAAWVSKSAMLIGQGDAWWASGAEGQAEAAYEAALHAAERALSLDPRCAEAAVNQASVHLSLGDAKAARGEDPSDEYQKALAGFDWVVSSLPRFAVAVHNQAKAHQSLGDAKRARGEDASDEYRKALAGYDNALSLEPRSEEAAIGQGNVHQSLGDAKRARGEDASDEYQKALAGYDRALSLNPRSASAASNRANLYHSLGDAKRARGEDAFDEYQTALAGYDRALSLNPRSASAASNRANLYHSLGDAKRARGEDASEEYQKALDGYDNALALNPRLAGAASNQGLLYESLGNAKRARGEDASEEYQKALDSHEKALSLNPRFAEAANNRANVYQSLGDAKRSRGEEATDEYQKAVDGYDRALSLNPAFWQAHGNRGLALESMARFREAAQAYEAALAIVKDGVPVLKEYLARARAAARREALPEWRQAAANADETIERGDYVAARALYEKALASAPADDAASRPVLRDCRYNLACILSLASAGLDGPNAKARLVDPAEAQRLRDAAFEHLAGAVELGYSDARHLSGDADLSPLHGDPRWAGLLRSLRK